MFLLLVVFIVGFCWLFLLCFQCYCFVFNFIALRSILLLCAQFYRFVFIVVGSCLSLSLNSEAAHRSSLLCAVFTVSLPLLTVAARIESCRSLPQQQRWWSSIRMLPSLHARLFLTSVSCLPVCRWETFVCRLSYTLRLFIVVVKKRSWFGDCSHVL